VQRPCHCDHASPDGADAAFGGTTRKLRRRSCGRANRIIGRDQRKSAFSSSQGCRERHRAQADQVSSILEAPLLRGAWNRPACEILATQPWARDFYPTSSPGTRIAASASARTGPRRTQKSVSQQDGAGSCPEGLELQAPRVRSAKLLLDQGGAAVDPVAKTAVCWCPRRGLNSRHGAAWVKSVLIRRMHAGKGKRFTDWLVGIDE
jgi:hypothetical protein